MNGEESYFGLELFNAFVRWSFSILQVVFGLNVLYVPHLGFECSVQFVLNFCICLSIVGCKALYYIM